MLLPIIYTVSTLDALAFVMLVTTFNQFVFTLNGTQFYLGLLGSTSAFINLFWNPIAGSLSDTFGRKTVLVQCLVCIFIGNFITIFATSLVTLFLARILTAFGTQVIPLLKSLIDDEIKDGTKLVIMQRMQAIGGFCFVFGALIGGFLTEHPMGFRIIYSVISGISAINLLLICLIKSHKVRVTSSVANELKKSVTSLVAVNWGKYWDLLLIKLVADISLSVFTFNFVQILLQNYGMKGKDIGLIFASVSILGIIASLSMNRIREYFYKNDTGFKRLLHTTLLLLYTCVGLSLSQNFVLYYLHLIPISICRVFFESTFTDVILQRVGSNEKGKVIGTFETTLALSGLVAPIFTGIVADQVGNQNCLLLCVLPLTISAFVAFTRLPTVENKKH